MTVAYRGEQFGDAHHVSKRTGISRCQVCAVHWAVGPNRCFVFSCNSERPHAVCMRCRDNILNVVGGMRCPICQDWSTEAERLLSAVNCRRALGKAEDWNGEARLLLSKDKIRYDDKVRICKAIVRLVPSSFAKMTCMHRHPSIVKAVATELTGHADNHSFIRDMTCAIAADEDVVGRQDVLLVLLDSLRKLVKAGVLLGDELIVLVSNIPYKLRLHEDVKARLVHILTCGEDSTRMLQCQVEGWKNVFPFLDMDVARRALTLLKEKVERVFAGDEMMDDNVQKQYYVDIIERGKKVCRAAPLAF